MWSPLFKNRDNMYLTLYWIGPVVFMIYRRIYQLNLALYRVGPVENLETDKTIKLQSLKD
jgi:hypothetical protein